MKGMFEERAVQPAAQLRHAGVTNMEDVLDAEAFNQLVNFDRRA